MNRIDKLFMWSVFIVIVPLVAFFGALEATIHYLKGERIPFED